MQYEDDIYIISEIGINASGNLNTAKLLIDVAKSAGCDCVKFQKRTPELCVPEKQKTMPKETPWGLMTYLEYRNKVEFGKDEYDAIDKHCKKVGIEWSASPWDANSLEFLEQYDLPWIKIASAMVTNDELIKAIGESSYKHIIMSTGMCTESDIRKAFSYLIDKWKRVDLLHCHGCYPAPPEELNLKRIHTLMEKFPEARRIGYSGHETGLWSTLSAVAMGAQIVERHITLDRSDWGTDQSASVEPGGLIKLVKCIRDFEKYSGDGKIRIMPSEEAHIKRLRK